MTVVTRGKKKSKMSEEFILSECDDAEVIDEIKQKLASLMNHTQEATSAEVETTAECNILERVHPKSEINPVEQKTKMVKVAVAMDTGATANVTPNGVFGVKVTPPPPGESDDFFGADNARILNLGTQVGNGTTTDAEPIDYSINFDVAKISRPLGSVSKLLKKNHRAMFDEGNSYIQNKSSGKKTKLREEGGLFFLDLLVEVPYDMPINPRFVRQVQS